MRLPVNDARFVEELFKVNTTIKAASADA